MPITPSLSKTSVESSRTTTTLGADNVRATSPLETARAAKRASSTPTVTARFTEAIGSTFAPGAIPPEVVQRAALCVLDLVGVSIAAHDTAIARTARTIAATEFGGDAGSVIADRSRLSTSGAALVNGTTGHALDFDDVIPGAGHPSTVVVPAALAVAETVDADGPTLLRSIVAGIEAHTMLGAAIGPSHYERGFHTTATLGVFGAAAAAGMLRGLDEKQMQMAYGIAGTQAAGLKAMFGTMTKPFHAGRAAANGVLAAAFAAEGFTAATDVLGVAQGFVATQSDTWLRDELLQAPATNGWRTLDVQFKMHSACYLTHASITALQALRAENQIQAPDVREVEIAAPPGHMDVCAIAEPATGLQGKFSFRYTGALALAGRSTGPTAFTDALVADPELLSMRDRITVVADSSLSGPVARVTLATRDGRTVTAHRDMLEVGADQSRLTERLQTKFHDNVAPVLGEERSQRLASAVLALPRSGSARQLLRLTRPDSGR